MSDARARANAEQRLASDPGVSAFVSASAGSGKTKLLTDRLLRLMLGGADPARIQCLTYTKAGAAEMALRLRQVLGRWVTLDDAALGAALERLDVASNDGTRQIARALFARVLDLPGGMRISTIHAFCQSLLRRFPLEAQVSPHFRLIEDADVASARRRAEEAVIGGSRPARGALTAEAERVELERAIARLAGLVNLAKFGELAAKFTQDGARVAALRAHGWEKVRAAQRAALCAFGSKAEVLRAAAAWPAEREVRDALRLAGARGTTTAKRGAQERLDWLSGDIAQRCATWDIYEASWLSAKGEPLSCRTVFGEALAKQEPAAWEVVQAEMARVDAVGDALRAAELAEVSEALLRLALPVSTEYAGTKAKTAALDYPDLIDRTTSLLVSPGAAWVLYKLDGGLDHLLFDEVQDTAPAQWEIAGKLTEEFFAGDAAQDRHRTVFAVGDRKQSIFSFQGAEPAAFDAWRGHLRERVQHAGLTWRDVTLDVSFRSTTPVLALVDAVLQDDEAARGVRDGEAVRHLSDRAGQAGAVELWPLAEATDMYAEPADWSVPDAPITATSAPQLLAETLAQWIADETSGAVALPSRGRPLQPGDVLILVRRRSEFSRSLARALKHRRVPVAGLDRMVLTEQPAVADLLTLCDALLLPDDHLSVACVLTSPLGGLDDDDLIALAPGRSGSLWDALHMRAGERPRWQAASDFLSALFRRADYATPHELLCEALGPLGGRARLLARLGDDAAEPIDSLLGQATAYARVEPPSLQGFVHWLRRRAAELKREPDGQGGLVRIMTVHGAKGLQAPLVILPDTTGEPAERETIHWAKADGIEVPVWAPVRDMHCSSFADLHATAKARRIEEENRLLYVALTRAEDRLVICGAKPARNKQPNSWYALLDRAMRRLGARAEPFSYGNGGERLVFTAPQTAAPDRREQPAAAASPAALPAWAGSAPDWRPQPPPSEPALPARLAPSRPEGVAFGQVPPAGSPLAGLGSRAALRRRGQVLHSLLQHLPALPSGDRASAAARFLAQPGLGFAQAEQDKTLADLLAVMSEPALAPLFGPEARAEVPLTGVVGGRVVTGLVDRLIIRSDEIMVAEFKTGRPPPSGPDATPVAYVRQMAAYRAVLQEAVPGRDVRCFLVWTETARVVQLPRSLLDSHAPGGGCA